MRLIALAALPLLVTLAGCVFEINTNDSEDGMRDWQHRQERNARAIRRLEPGRSRESIESQLGEADFVESFSRGGQEFVVLFYRTHRVHDDGITSKDETTPLVFAGGDLVGWGESAVEYATTD